MLNVYVDYANLTSLPNKWLQ